MLFVGIVVPQTNPNGWNGEYLRESGFASVQLVEYRPSLDLHGRENGDWYYPISIDATIDEMAAKLQANAWSDQVAEELSPEELREQFVEMAKRYVWSNTVIILR